MRKRLIVLGLLVLLERGMTLVIRWFEVLPIVVVLHFLAVLAIVFAAVGGLVGSGAVRERERARRDRGILGVLVVVLVALTMGAWTSVHIGGPEACQGFPLCNGAWLPRGGKLVFANWSHRFISFITLAVVLFYTLREYRLKSRTKIRITATIAAIIVLMQTGIGAGLVLRQVPRWVVGIHLAVGVALWGIVVLWYKLSRTHYSS